MNEVGISVLKKDLTVLAKLTKTVDAALEDGRVSIAEGVGAAFKAIDLIGVVKTVKAAKAEIKDLTADEIAELAAHFKAEFDLRNDRAEELVETILELALQFANATELFSKLKN